MSFSLRTLSFAAAGVAGLLVSATTALAQAQAPAVANTPMPIGFLDLADDPRFDEEREYYMVPVRPFGRHNVAAQLAIQDALTIGNVIHVDFSLVEASAASVDDAISTVQGWLDQGVHFVVADLPADALLAVSDAFAGQDITIFNSAAHEDTLRGESCRANIVHTAPSYRQLTDAMTQFLVSHQWRNILVLQGPSEADAETVAALQTSANFFGARITDVREFILSNDPRNREQSNIALITADGNYDVVYVADSDGEFARFAPYEVNDPRPVVGSAGLVATAWHWSYQKQGSSEITYRIEQMLGNLRHVDDGDWTAWISIRLVVQSVLRSNSTDFDAIMAYMLGDRMNLDGGKGNPMSVRPWDHQLRQAIPLSAGNVVLEEAPIEGFLHQTNDLDTLGVDEPQSTCQF